MISLGGIDLVSTVGNGNIDLRDMLTAYDGETITHDEIGNPLCDGEWTYTWEHGRELAAMSDGYSTWEFTYDANGMRTRRTHQDIEYQYVYNGSQLTQLTVLETGGGELATNTLYFTYSADGTPLTVTSEDQLYFYVTNIQGDVIAILDHAGRVVCRYIYDAWGNVTTDSWLGDIVADHNPLRYRGYVYDQETELYYLQSRYYSPEQGRFLNADALVSTGQGPLGNNMFAYCGNNPVNRVDPTGEAWWHWALGAAVVAACAVATVATCGGFAAAAMAVTMVSSGVAATTAASTVAAAAFIGSATVYGAAVITAASDASSAQDFADRGNWGMVAATAGSAVFNATYAYLSTRNTTLSQSSQTTNTSYNLNGSKDSNYLAKRGWSGDMINTAINNGKQGTSVNMANNEICSVYTYPGVGNQYVVIEDSSGSVVQVSNFNDPNWIPDSRIVWDRRG